MKKTISILTLFTTAFWLAPTMGAAELGDPAPALQIAEWVKGKPVDLAAGKGKTIFVVEFWATWCPPCRTSIPHLTGLQKKFKAQNVVFIGVSNEKAATVKIFVDKMGDQMDYAVAVDQDNKTSAGYMEAFGINGIPHAFIVDQQARIVWSGHPMGELEKSLSQLVEGKYDLGVAKKRAYAQKKMQEFFELAAKGEDDAQVNALGKELEKLDQEVGGLLPNQPFETAKLKKTARFQSLIAQYQRALLQDNDAAKAEDLGKQLQSFAPEGFKLEDFKATLQLRKLFVDYYQAASGQSDDAKLEELSKKLAATPAKNAMMLNDIAWALLTDQKIKKRDLPLALKLARAAYDASEGKEAAIVDTYARAMFDNGKMDEAIQLQKKAVELCKDDTQRAVLEKNLKEFQEKAGAK
jgi:thiol-disulfide isomerase/thioredoxin